MQRAPFVPRILISPALFVIVASIFAALMPNIAAQSGQQKGIDALPENVKALPEQGKRVALIIGINDYDDAQIKKLVGAVNDAKDLKDALIRSAGFDESRIILLTSDEKDPDYRPTVRNILSWLNKLKLLVPKDGLLLFAFSGHGVSSDEQAFLLPSDATMSTDKNLLKRFAIPVTDVAEYIKKTGVRQMVMLLDACRNNAAGKDVGDSGSGLTPAWTEPFDFKKRNGEIDALVTVYATQPGGRAWEDPKTSRGYFMETVIEGINGAARNPATGEVTLERFRKYVEEKVLDRTMRLTEPQKPRFLADGYNGDLVIAKVAPTVKPRVPFSIRTYPDTVAAKIVIKSQGKIIHEATTVDGETRAELDPGSYDIEVSATKYKLISRPIAINVGGKAFETFRLAPKTGSIKIVLVELSPDDNKLQVFLDDKLARFTKVEKTTIALSDIDEGPHRLRIEHPSIGDSGKEEAIELKGGEEFVRVAIAKVVPSLKVPFSIRTYPETVVAKVAIKSQGKTILEGTTLDGELPAQLDQGNYEIEVSADKYKTQSRTIAISVGGKTFEPFRLAPRTASIKIILVQISPDDNNLRVFLDDKPARFTKMENATVVLKDIDEGTHRMRIEHPSIAESGKEEAISFKGGEDLVRVVVAKPSVAPPAPGSLLGAFSLRANVSSAKVAIRSEGKSLPDGEIINGEFHTELPAGAYDLEVTAEKYKPKPWKKHISIQSGKASSEAVVLESEVGSIIVDLGQVKPDDKDLQILIDGRRASFTTRKDSRIELMDIDERPHQLRVEHPTAIALDESVNLHGGGTMNFRLYPRPSSPVATIGTLSIGVNVNSRIVVRSRTSAFREERQVSSQLLLELSPGGYDIEVMADGYRAWKKLVEIKRGEVAPLPVTLERDLLSVTLKGPAGASIYLDKTFKGVITDSGELVLVDIVPGNHTVLARMVSFTDRLIDKNFTANETLPIEMNRIIYSAEFTDEFKDWMNWEAPSSWKPRADGKPGLRVSGPGKGYRRDTIYKDFDMHMTISINDDTGAVWIVRARDKANYYLFQLTPTQFTTYICKDGQTSRVGSSQAISRNLLPRSGEMFRVHVTANTSEIRTFIKDKDGVDKPISVLKSPDAALSDGRIGFGTLDKEDFTIHLLTVIPGGK